MGFNNAQTMQLAKMHVTTHLAVLTLAGKDVSVDS